MLRSPAINPINISARLVPFFLLPMLMEEVVHVRESELFGEAELVFSVDTATELSRVAENTVVPIVVQDNPENLTDCELPNQPATTLRQSRRDGFSREVVRRELIEEAEVVLVDTIGFSGIPENIVLAMQ